jgi:hypothetical protein
MSETPEQQTDPLQLRTQALSALERALRDALAVAPLEQVLQRVRVMFAGSPVETGTGVGSRFYGRVQKVSVSMPEELSAAVRERTGPGGFSRYVAEAVEERLRQQGLDELSAYLDAKYGPVPEELIQEAMREWPDYEEE